MVHIANRIVDSNVGNFWNRRVPNTSIDVTSYKSNRLEVFQMVLLANKAMPEHQVTGEITVQCIEGSIEFTTAGTRQLMRAGDLVCLAGGVVHALKAVEDSSVLVTILLHSA